MTTRQKFWIKVVLTVTLPVWLIPVALMGSIAILGYGAWMLCGDMVDDLTGPSE